MLQISLTMPSGCSEFNEKDDAALYEEDSLQSDPELDYYLDVPRPLIRRRSSSLPDKDMCALVGNMYYNLQSENGYGRKKTVGKRVKKLSLKKQKQRPAFISQDQIPTIIPKDRPIRPRFNRQSSHKQFHEKRHIDEMDESEDECQPLEPPDNPTTQSKKGYWRRNKDGTSFFIGSGSESEVDFKDYKHKKAQVQPVQPEHTIRKHLIRASSISSHDSDGEMEATRSDIYRFTLEDEASSQSSDSGEETSLLQREDLEMEFKMDQDTTTKAKWEKLKTFITSGTSIFDSLKKDEQKINSAASEQKLSCSLPTNAWLSPMTTRRIRCRSRSSSLSSSEGAASTDKQEKEREEEEEKKPSIFTLAMALIKKSKNPQ